MRVNIALLTVTDTRTLKTDKSGSILVKKIKEGLSEHEVYDFMAEKYGDWILFNPPVKKNSLILWFLPYLLFILGGGAIYLLSKKRLIEKK